MPNIPIKMNQLSNHNTDIDNIELIGYKEENGEPIRLSSSSFLYNSLPSFELKIVENTRLFIKHKRLTFPLYIKILKKTKQGRHGGLGKPDRENKNGDSWYNEKIIELQVEASDDWYEIPEFYNNFIRVCWNGDKTTGYKHTRTHNHLIGINESMSKYGSAKFAIQIAIQNPNAIIGRPQNDYLTGQTIYFKHNLTCKSLELEPEPQPPGGEAAPPSYNPVLNPWTEEYIGNGEAWIFPSLSIQ